MESLRSPGDSPAERDVTGARLDHDAPADVQAVIASIGRTEDLALSPDNSRLVIVDYFGRRLFVFAIRIETTGVSPQVTLSDCATLRSDALRETHGVAFLGNDHIAVCNRAGDVCIYRLPVPGLHPREQSVEPLARIRGHGLFSARVLTPGSVDSRELAPNQYRVLVCNDAWNAVTAHRVSLGGSIRIRNEGILIESRLKIPDGVAFSRDAAWIAISNHVDGEVLIYANHPGLDRRTPPAAILRGLVCPHGVRFTSRGRLLVADAGSQYLHAFDSAAGSWRGIRQPTASVRVVDDETFYAGRYDSREGGVKGIEVDRNDRVLMTTHKRDVLAFYDLDALLSTADIVDSAEMDELRRQRDSSVHQKKHDVVNRRWTFPTRVTLGFSELRQRYRRRTEAARSRAILSQLSRINEQSRESLLDPAGPVVSMTTQPHRLQLVHFAVECIARGVRKPRALHLWIGDEQSHSNLPASLKRLEARGLEIHLTEDRGPHTKYYPYVHGETRFAAPLVTADDDVLYPADWLEQLIRGYEANPSAIHCFRAHRMRMAGDRPTPYNSWGPCEDTRPSHLNFITGVSGVIYPPEFLRYLKHHGKDYAPFCPHSDDMWLTVIALRGGFQIAQLHEKPRLFPTTPGSQAKRLSTLNVTLGENQVQLMRTLAPADLTRLQGHHKPC